MCGTPQWREKLMTKIRNSALIFFLILYSVVFIQTPVHAGTLDAKEYHKKMISLYKDLKILKANLMLNNDLNNKCGVGACAPKEVKQWYSRWKKLNATKCINGFPFLETTLEDSAAMSQNK